MAAVDFPDNPTVVREKGEIRQISSRPAVHAPPTALQSSPAARRLPSGVPPQLAVRPLPQ
jgi:hypothetical protein